MDAFVLSAFLVCFFIIRYVLEWEAIVVNLLFVWDDNYSGLERNVGYLLTSKFDVKFDAYEKKLLISPNIQYINGFFGDNILDVGAVVGENGSGKTRLAYCIMDIMEQLEGVNNYTFDFFVLFEDEEDKKFKIYVSDKYKDIQVDVKDMNFDYIIKIQNPFDEFMQYKVAYFTNALSLNDYNPRKHGYVYDASVGGLMRNSYLEKFEMNYIDKEKNIIFNYYETEIEKMIKFLYTDIDKMKIPFRVPKKIVIKLNNYSQNEQYINNELVKARQHNKQLQEIIGVDEKPFSKYIGKLLDCYEKTWTNSLLINLIMNLFREICIPQTTGDNKNVQIRGFIVALQEQQRNKKYGTLMDPFDMTISLLDAVEKNVHRSSYYVCKYREFIEWIFKNKTLFEKNSNSINWGCTFELNSNNEKNIMQLLKFYDKTNFPYTYFSFDFRLSTGEFNFLNIFTNIHIALTTRNLTVTGKIDCTNVLLFFDEADLSLHPKWQREYVDWITRFVSSCAQGCKVQIIIATYSPIMLSDFPMGNVLYLDEGKIISRLSAQRKNSTFGNNIHTLFLDSFFLNNIGTMGAFAQKKINEILRMLRSEERIDDKDKRILKTIECIGDNLIKDKLLELYDKNQGLSNSEEKMQLSLDEQTIDNTITVLKRQVDELNRSIKCLEQMKND